MKASGEFSVELKPADPYFAGEHGNKINRMSIDKRYSGDLQALGCGEMLSVLTETEGSAGYVAIEQVTGTLCGKHGSFCLQHSGTMSRGSAHLDLHVVEDSGSGELSGLSGRMFIVVENGQHFYECEFELPEV